MPSYFPEGDTPKPQDYENRSLQKINNLLLTSANNLTNLYTDAVTGASKLGLFRAVSTALITRPNDSTPYTAGDIVGTATASDNRFAFNNLFRSTDGGYIVKARLITSSTSVTNGTFRLMLFTTNTYGIVADNSPFVPSFSDNDVRIGNIDFTLAQTHTGALATAFVQDARIACFGATTIYASLAVTGAYTPIPNQTFKIELIADQN
jgi:hypothetical protein